MLGASPSSRSKVELRGVVEGEARRLAKLRVEVLQLALELAVRLLSTFSLVGASTQSIRRSTVNGRITSGYLLRLKRIPQQVGNATK